MSSISIYENNIILFNFLYKKLIPITGEILVDNNAYYRNKLDCELPASKNLPELLSSLRNILSKKQEYSVAIYDTLMSINFDQDLKSSTKFFDCFKTTSIYHHGLLGNWGNCETLYNWVWVSEELVEVGFEQKF